MSVSRLRWLGLLLTAAWVGLVIWYVFDGAPPNKRPWSLDPNNFGDFLAGTAGPLALLWLVLAFFIQSAQLDAQGKSVAAQEAALRATERAIELQRQSLDMQREELGLQRQETAKLASEATKQAESLRLSELNARRDTYMRIYELTLPSQVACAFRICDDLEHSAIHSTLEKHARGDSEAVFSLGVRLLRGNPGYLSPGSRATADTQYSVMRFIDVFEDLATQSMDADPSGALRKNLEKSGMGSFYAALCLISHRTVVFSFRERPTGRDQLLY
jgi:hypothetical protein